MSKSPKHGRPLPPEVIMNKDFKIIVRDSNVSVFELPVGAMISGLPSKLAALQEILIYQRPEHPSGFAL